MTQTTTAIDTPQTLDELDQDVKAIAGTDEEPEQLPELWPASKEDYQLRRNIETYLDTKGAYPRRYRAYTVEEWQEALDALAATVNGLPETAPEYQHETGLYVEEHGRGLLLIRAKTYELFIQIPAQANKTSKVLEIRDRRGNGYSYGFTARRPTLVAELLEHVADDEMRDRIRDLFAQYIRDVRLTLNGQALKADRPDLAKPLEHYLSRDY